MTPETIYFLISSLLAVILTWLLKKYTWELLAIWSLIALTYISPISASWLLSSSLFTSAVISIGDRTGHQGYLTTFGTIVLLTLLLVFREIPQILWIGGAYFTLRNLHILFDWWMGKISNPGIIRNLRYQLFLPTLISGPIGRLQVFERQVERRCWDSTDFFSGMERLLFGMAQVIVLGGWLITQTEAKLLTSILQHHVFLADWTYSALNWIELYFVFSGYSSIALGLALMMGLRLEENFNHPWAAKNLIDFWLRWHITLSQWVKDYVFQPVTAYLRSPIAGLIAAMLAIGLWHDTSVYYALWALWQSLGIILTRLFQSLIKEKPTIQKKTTRISFLSPILILAWLSLAHPLVTRFLGLFS